MLTECFWCHKQVERNPAKVKGRVFCSPGCNGAYRTDAALVTKECTICGDDFKVKRCHQTSRATCGKEECRSKARSLVMLKMQSANRSGRSIPECHPDREYGAHGLCSSCYRKEHAKGYRAKGNEASRRWRAANPDKVQDSYRKKRYGVGNDYFDTQFKLQDGLCAICKLAPAKDIDHNHETKKARGLLCGSCNRAIGLFKESQEIMNGAIQYLRDWQESDVSK